MRRVLSILAVLAAPYAADAGQGFTFASIDGGDIALDDWAGQPVLVVNTASRCGFTPQYDGLQELYDTYRDRGLVVLAVPSDDFRQELDSAAEVQAFCEVNFNLTLPMTDITTVTGPDAHPFYRWLADSHGFAPTWNFNKVLIGPDGAFVAGFGSSVRPDARPILSAIRPLLGGS